MSWDEVPLLSVCEVSTGKYDANHGVVNGSYQFYTCAEKPIRSNTYSFEGSSIILPGNGANVGLVLYFDGKFEAYQRTYVLNNFRRDVDSKYVYHHLNRYWKLRNEKAQYGSATNYIRMQNFKDYTIPLPPLDEQKRIAAILDKADAIRQKRKQAIDLADEFLRSVFLDMFGDPVTNPKGWEVTTCGETFKLSSGKGLTAKNMDKDGNYLVYGGNGINGKHSEYMFEEPQLIIGRVGVYCGSIHITEKKSWVTDNAMYIKEYLKKVNIIFLAQLLDLANLNQYAGKAAQPLISGNRIYPLEIIFPPIEEQERFAKIHKVFIESITKLHGGLESKSDLFQSLSQKAFSGQL
ncbi:TPA: restriction endonuclease subunit S [Vibrio cholerae]|nr:restriction endonuclease subunit S [Vibrio cholerae]